MRLSVQILGYEQSDELKKYLLSFVEYVFYQSTIADTKYNSDVQ